MRRSTRHRPDDLRTDREVMADDAIFEERNRCRAKGACNGAAHRREEQRSGPLGGVTCFCASSMRGHQDMTDSTAEPICQILGKLLLSRRDLWCRLMRYKDHVPRHCCERLQSAGEGVEAAGKHDHLLGPERPFAGVKVQEACHSRRVVSLDELELEVVACQETHSRGQCLLNFRLAPDLRATDWNGQMQVSVPIGTHLRTDVTSARDFTVRVENRSRDIEQIQHLIIEITDRSRGDALGPQPERRVGTIHTEWQHTTAFVIHQNAVRHPCLASREAPQPPCASTHGQSRVHQRERWSPWCRRSFRPSLKKTPG